LLLIDGNSLFHRAYHALPPLSDKTGVNANAVFGFSNMLLKAIGEIKPDFIACAFDTAAPTFRHVEFEKYKAQRPSPPPDLYPQLPKVKKVLDAFDIPYFEKEGYEADDLIATIASKAISPLVIARSKATKQSKKRKIATSLDKLGTRNDNVVDQVIILSGDRDVLQLVDGDVKVQMPGWNMRETTLFGAKEVKEKYGLEPHQMVDYKSLIGDPSDNVPGISGIGPKTASALLQKYHTLENLFKHISETSEIVRSKLEVGREIALAAKRLVELDRDVDIGFKIDDLRFSPDWERVRQEYEQLGFKSIVGKIPGTKGSNGPFDKTQGEPKEPKDKNSDQLELI